MAAAKTPGPDPEKGVVGSPSSSGSTDSWQSSGGGSSPLLVAAALPRRTGSKRSERSAGGSGRLYRQVSSGAVGTAPSSPARVYRQPQDGPGSPRRGPHPKAGTGRQYEQPPAAPKSPSPSPSPAKPAQGAASPGGGTRSPGRLYSQPRPAARRQLSSGGAPAAPVPMEADAVDNPLWTLAPPPPTATAQPAATAAAASWTTNPVAEETSVGDPRAPQAAPQPLAAVHQPPTVAPSWLAAAPQW
jgi:hypothetical protein